MMEIFQSIIYSVDSVLDSKRKRHVLGGALLSVSALFGGLAVKVMTIADEEEKNNEE